MRKIPFIARWTPRRLIAISRYVDDMNLTDRLTLKFGYGYPLGKLRLLRQKTIGIGAKKIAVKLKINNEVKIKALEEIMSISSEPGKTEKNQ